MTDPVAERPAQEPGATASELSEFRKLLDAPAKPFTLAPKNITELTEYAKMIAASAFCPKELQGKPGDVAIVIQMGAEFGIPPLQALGGIALINGRATMWGDLVIALVEHSHLLLQKRETWDAATQTARCELWRKGKPEPISRTFSMDDAKRAKQTRWDKNTNQRVTEALADKDTYKSYPQRMCQMRARSWALRDEFADVLKGLWVREEVEDFPQLMQRPMVSMPERVSAGGLTAQVDEFLRGTEPPRANPKPPVEAQRHEGPVSEVSARSGKTNGREWVIYDVHSEEQIFSTFSETLATKARMFEGTGEAVVIDWEPTKKGSRSIVALEAAVQPPVEVDPHPGL